MIKGIHGMFFTDQAEELRTFIKDKLSLPYTDVGGGWLIFDLPQADLGVHPIGEDGKPPTGTHDISFFCDDIHKTVAELTANGVEFSDEISDPGYGLTIHFEMPGGIKVELYQPHYSKNPTS